MKRLQLSSRAAMAIASLTMALTIAACGPSVATQTTVAVAGLDNRHATIAAEGDQVAVAWSAVSEDGRADVYAAVSGDGGRSFSAPVRVNPPDRPVSVSGEQPPRIVFLNGAAQPSDVAVVWTAKLDGATAILSATSKDGGRTFGAPALVSEADASGNRGWHSIAADEDGRVHVVWLDHRDAVTSEAGMPHAHADGGAASHPAEDGVARAQRSQLFVGTLDGSIPPRAIARGVCYCCKTAVATGTDGSVHVAWRHVYDGNIRDIAFAVSRDRGRTFSEPVRVSDDQWQLDGCPENGPGVAVDPGNRIHVVWPSLVGKGAGETLAMFLASSSDGRTFTPRVALPTTGAAYHPDVVADVDGTLLMAWDELESGQRRRVRVVRGLPNRGGGMNFELLRLGDEDAGSYPTLALTSRSIVVAWNRSSESSSAIVVRSIPR